MSGELVLVVDDEPTVREVVSRYLELGGYRVAVAGDGQEALRLALSTQAPPDLVVLDLMLPGMDGLEVCRRLRASAPIPIVMLTARGHEADRIVGLELGADDYVVKPFSPRELVARIRSVLRRARGDPAAQQGRVHAGDVRGRGRRAPGRPDRAGVRAAAVPGPPPAPGVHARSAPAAGVGVHLARGHLDRHRAHPAPAREGRGQPLRPAADPDGLRGRLPLRAAGAERVTGRWRASLVAAAIFAGGLAGSVAVALAVDIPAHDLVLLLGLTTIGAVAVVLVGLVVQGGLRRRGAGVARHVGLTAVVTAGAALAAIQAASSAMLVSTHDLLVVLVSLPVAIGAGIAYGIASSRAMVTDLEALAARAAALEAGAGASSPAEQARPSVAGRRSGGTAEVATVAEALEAAEARLAAARERERAMDASRRDLIAWISHDLRTPPASLPPLPEAHADGVAIDEATRGRYLAGLLAHIDRLTGLVDALLELSQVEAGALAFEREPVSLPELVAEVLEGFEPEAAAGGVRLQTAAGNGGALVLAGRDQLNRVLANLVHNGIRHTRPGGRLLVTIGQRADGGAVTLRVRDGCGGIAEPDLARVFDRLWRGDPARSSRGAGLGLAI